MSDAQSTNGRQSRNRRSSGRNGRGAQPRQLRPEDLWRTGLPLPDAEPITPVDDPTALVRSLGDPPLPGNRLPASHYVATVVERAAVLASALAASAGLLAEPDEAPAD